MDNACFYNTRGSGGLHNSSTFPILNFNSAIQHGMFIESANTQNSFISNRDWSPKFATDKWPIPDPF